MAKNSSGPNSSHLIWALGGVATGIYLSRNQLETSKKSRAEIDDPDGTEEVCEEIAELLEKWEPSDDCESEDEFTQDIADFLSENCEWEIEVYPDSPEGKPDILVGDLLALELKVSLDKSERDRLIGQCAGYSRLWVTWAVVINASESSLGRLVDLLEDKGLEHITVWGF